MNIENLRYPIGRFQLPDMKDPAHRKASVDELQHFPLKLRAAVTSLSPAVLNCPYREGGWTINQLVHHLADSHLNSYLRCKLALTEDQPIIKPYEEALWAELPDAMNEDILSSMLILDGIHRRWTNMYLNLSDTDWNRSFFHPEYERLISLEYNLAFYAWHGRHHLAHINALINK